MVNMKKKIKAKLVDLIDPANQSEESAYYLPADAASVEAMVAQIKKAWLDADESEHIDDMARITLAAIGIKGGAK